MLKPRHNIKVPLTITSLGLGGLFLFQYLTFIPEYSHATTASTESRTLADISTMQEMTPDICFNTDPGATKQLEDTRLNDDGMTRTYWVTKLPDGNCWMTQNLDYDDPGGTKVTDTTGSNGGPGSGKWQSDNTVRQYWDPGEKVVSGSGLGNPGTDKHLLVGNYYSWLSAMAGNNGTGTGTDGSICPAGWQLPTSNNTNNGSFAYLQTQGSIGSTGSKLNSEPYFFPYSGNVYSGNLYLAGSYGYCWSSTPNGSAGAYLLTFSSTSVNPSDGDGRSNGRSVRCLTIAQRTAPDDLNVSVTVSPVLTLTIDSHLVTIDSELYRVNTGEFTAEVSSSYGYTLALSAAEPALTNPSINSSSIPALSTGEVVTAGVSGWGIRACKQADKSDCSDSNNVTRNNQFVGLSNRPTEFDKSSIGVVKRPTTFQVGVGIGPNLPAGAYSTTVTVTASQD